ncbi:MAG: hypothetical protein FH761_16730 [Firmicutes bacterium]|nr:hypothetical protein [Bacillota bacterium]
MLFKNLTKLIDKQIYFNGDEGENLLLYVNQECIVECDVTWSLEHPPECDCPVARLYYAMVKLAEWENKGINLKEFEKMINEHEELKKQIQFWKDFFIKEINEWEKMHNKLLIDRNNEIKKRLKTKEQNRELVKVAKSLHEAIAFDSKDYSINRTDAWLYGIIIGWDNSSIKELQNKFDWTDLTCERLKCLHEVFINVNPYKELVERG